MLSASSVLFYWDAALKGALPVIGGDPVFARDGSGYFIDSEKKIRKAIVHRPRFEWQDLGDDLGARPCMLLEPGRINRLTYVFELDNAAWTKNAVTITPDAYPSADPTRTLDRIVETATNTNHYIRRGVTFTANNRQSFSVEVAPSGRTMGSFYLLDGADLVGVAFDLTAMTVTAIPTGAGVVHHREIVALANGNCIVAFTGTLNATSTSGNFDLLLKDGAGATGYLGDVTKGMYAGGSQHERDAAFPTSRIVSDAAETARPVDILYWKNPPAPQGMATYCRFRLRDGNLGNDERIWEMGDAASPSPRFLLYRPAGTNQFSTYHQNTVGGVQDAVAAATAAGDVIECVSVLHEDGKVRTYVAVNGGTPLSGALSAADALAAAWAGQRLYVNSVGTSFVGGNKYADMKVVKLADMAGQPGVASAAAVMSELRNFKMNASGVVI